MSAPTPPSSDSPTGYTNQLASIVDRIQRPDFFFVNIGANDGISGDPIYPFIVKYGWHGIAVEPMGYLCDELRRNYAGFEGVIIEQAAIARVPRPFYYIAPDATDAAFVRQIASMNNAYIEKTISLFREYEFEGPIREGLERSIQKVEVPCLTFDELLAKHHVRRIDFLNIDAESADFEILMMVDFSRWHPAIICLEMSEFSEQEKVQAGEALRLAGYGFLEAFDPFSMVFLRTEYLPA